MRISDWSSDVCSADLQSIQVHACHSRLREVEVLHDRLRAMLDPATAEGARFDPPLQPREIAVLAPNKLGRASCRERVCKYVSLSVVAVSLKERRLGKKRVRSYT